MSGNTTRFESMFLKRKNRRLPEVLNKILNYAVFVVFEVTVRHSENETKIAFFVL